MKKAYLLLIAMAALLMACNTHKGFVSSPSQNQDPKVDLGYTYANSDIHAGSASTLKTKNEVGSLSEFMRKVPGLLVYGNGQNATIRVRAVTNSFYGNNDPLFIIDGTRVGNSFSTVAGMLSAGEVERVTVLKDPSDTGIYGFAGSNGVIIIRTKKK